MTTSKNLAPELIDGVPVEFRSQDGKFAFINECRLIDHLWPGRPHLERDYFEDGKVMMAWCKEHKASWYSFEKHEFSRYDAIAQAQAEGNTIIIMEGLS